MTSKEKLLKIRHDFYTNEEVKYDSIDYFTAIEKDLEVLEILKKHIYFSTKSGCIRMKDIYKSTKNFDFEELKEWLEK